MKFIDQVGTMGVRLPSSWMESCLNIHHQVSIAIFNFSAIFTSVCGLIISYCRLMTFNSNFVYFQISNTQKREVFFFYSDVQLEAFCLNSEMKQSMSMTGSCSFVPSSFLILRSTKYCRELQVFISYSNLITLFQKMLSCLFTSPFTIQCP